MKHGEPQAKAARDRIRSAKGDDRKRMLEQIRAIVVEWRSGSESSHEAMNRIDDVLSHRLVKP